MFNNKGFTLIELLVVVLIIGILAAIAVPKYQLAVGKSKFATVKSTTKALAEAEEAYYLANGKYTNQFSNLDITIPSNIRCWLWAFEGGQQASACWTYVNNIEIKYYQFFNFSSYNPRGRVCMCSNTDPNHICHLICKQETGKTTARYCSTQDNYCQYYY